MPFGYLSGKFKILMNQFIHLPQERHQDYRQCHESHHEYQQLVQGQKWGHKYNPFVIQTILDELPLLGERPS